MMQHTVGVVASNAPILVGWRPASGAQETSCSKRAPGSEHLQPAYPLATGSSLASPQARLLRLPAAVALAAGAHGLRRRSKRAQRCQRRSNDHTKSGAELLELSDAKLELLGGLPEAGGKRAETLLFIHGSYHAAWCWEKHFLPFFRSKGYAAYALSLRSQGNGSVVGEPASVAGTLECHAADVASCVEMLHERHSQPVVVVGHSFGGLIVQRAVADLCQSRREVLAGMGLLSSVPPGGLGSGIWRGLLSDPGLAFQITWGFMTRAFERDLKLCRQLFFDADMDMALVEEFSGMMKSSSPPGTRLLDLRELQKSLPVPALQQVPVLVFGGDGDKIVDGVALEETAEAHRAKLIPLKGLPHDAMLSPKWTECAEALETWLQSLKQ